MLKSISRILLASALLAPVSAFAGLVRVDFTVTSTGSTLTPGADYAGFGAGIVGGGYFTYDDALGAGLDVTAGLPTLDLSFNWLGYSYTEANARLYQVAFDSLGNINGWGFGPTMGSTVENCGLNCYSYPGATDFWVVGYPPEYLPYYESFSHFHIEGYDGAMYGSVTWSAHAADVPEPATLGLFGLGLLGIGAMRRKRAA